jgi:hypothetical protein
MGGGLRKPRITGAPAGMARVEFDNYAVFALFPVNFSVEDFEHPATAGGYISLRNAILCDINSRNVVR